MYIIDGVRFNGQLFQVRKRETSASDDGFNKPCGDVNDFRENITVMIFSSVNHSDGKDLHTLVTAALYRQRRSK